MKKKIWFVSYFILDVLLIFGSFAIIAWYMKGTRNILKGYSKPFIGYLFTWQLTGLWGGKFSIRKKNSIQDIWKSIIVNDVFAVAIIVCAILFFRRFTYSRHLVFGTMVLSVVTEMIIFTLLYFSFRFHMDNPSFAKTSFVTKSKILEEIPSGIESKNYNPVHENLPADDDYSVLNKYAPFKPGVIENIQSDLKNKFLASKTQLYEFLHEYIDLQVFSKQDSLVIDSQTFYNIEIIERNSRELFVNLHRINDFRRINRFLIQLNEIIKKDGVLVACVETIDEQKKRLMETYTPFFGSILYIFDFMFRRIFPKIILLKGFYFAVTHGRNRALSETEVLGRLYYCGFELIEKRKIGNLLYLIARKVQNPHNDDNPSYGPLIKLKRRGKDGKIIYLYKVRTMHPYSEYLQSYIYKKYNLQKGGKFADDPRVTSWGRIFRKLWIDELPQFINFFKGEVGLVGVRALSEHYFSLYPRDVQQLRIRVKPGLLPPFYADMPETFEEIVQSEKKYLEKKLVHPFRTDFIYFFKCFYNILFKKVTSS
jgi:lipopolysaccharide/colanic/teichoic acid biosynthesis glycosyltransferase